MIDRTTAFLEVREVLGEIAAHYANAVCKHPRFADKFADACTSAYRRRTLKEARAALATAREISAEDVLLCEVCEIFEAHSRGERAAAIAECYDAIAVLLRIVDALEGRQPLGVLNVETGTEATR